MTNNDMIIRLRYALDIKNTDLVEMFKLGGMKYTKEEVLNMLQKVKEDEEPPANFVEVTNEMLESFLNGLIIFKRGPQKPREGAAPTPTAPPVKESANNMLLKKVKIALTMTSEDMLDTLYDGGVVVSKGELGAILRNPSHRNYKPCGDRFARNFIRGLTVHYRDADKK
ncbi:hypothetical protein KZO01_20500 [Kurthia zopfii]|uniref:Protein of uncharacterized function (DUF1456) n=1 Tax=Kurthia zopfii TaxID=1650 RepID=A0A2U3AD68_9BACL|nr:DUF1456 family protein [Kurthia zopfii]PWI22447.1 DUF1456 domain-containing protein [Kurthia zopfii]TDR38828.1 uncharacterized protein YehS (DUF1456 family) [Kurthia zopfii]STX10734.1 Protein of uncharacterised function (DUF1456) [Kurthia zopfii]VEI05878.1 Protein of uncharacterised function (DUF1456) [Kurthia zopfii]GEK31741.1 hypothetical protein KZO01_20500 [Kurthia zopfii]